MRGGEKKKSQAAQKSGSSKRLIDRADLWQFGFRNSNAVGKAILRFKT